LVFANATVATGFAPRASAARGISRDAPRTAEPARTNLASRKKASRLRFGGGAAAAASRAGALRRRVAVSKRAETFRLRFRLCFRSRRGRRHIAARERNGYVSGGGGNDERRARIRRFGSARKIRFGKIVTGKTRGTERFLASHVRRLPCQRGDDAEGRSSHLRKRRGVCPPRLRLGVERGDRTLADVHRDAASPGRAR